MLNAGAVMCEQNNLCTSYQMYQDITGNMGSPTNENVSVSHGMRTAMFHVVAANMSMGYLDGNMYKFGNHSYFSESAYTMANWKERLWGAETYAKLLAIKQQWDPTQVFWCRHCVGSDIDFGDTTQEHRDKPVHEQTPPSPVVPQMERTEMICADHSTIALAHMALSLVVALAAVLAWRHTRPTDEFLLIHDK